MTQPAKAKSKLADTSGNPQVADRLAAVADISVTGTYATDDTPIETAVNGILAALRAHGLIAD